METGRENSSTRRPGARPRLFISYRRRSDAPSARLLKRELARAFGEGAVFRDVDDIEGGEDFAESISEAVEHCDAFLLLISPGWVELIEELRRDDDFVRREVAAALARGVTLIPLLLGDARMPKADELPGEIRDLAFRQAIELSDERWDYDVERLVKLVRARAGLPEPGSAFGRIAAAARAFFGTRLGKAVVFLAVIAALLPLAAPALWRAFLWYDLRRDFQNCVGFYAPDAPGGMARIEMGESAVPVVSADGYYRVREGRDGPDGVPLVLTLTDSGKEVGAVFLRLRGPSADNTTFTVERILAPPCDEVEDYRNNGVPAADKHYLKNWDTLRVRLGGRDYYLRMGDHGDYVVASLTPMSMN